MAKRLAPHEIMRLVRAGKMRLPVQQIIRLNTAPVVPPGPVNDFQNSTFDTDTVWTKGSGVTISGGKANAVSATTILSQGGLTPGVSYTVSFDWTRAVEFANTGKLRLENPPGNVVKVFENATGTGTTETFTFVPTDPTIALGADSNVFTGTIDNFTATRTA